MGEVESLRAQLEAAREELKQSQADFHAKACWRDCPCEPRKLEAAQEEAKRLQASDQQTMGMYLSAFERAEVLERERDAAQAQVERLTAALGKPCKQPDNVDSACPCCQPRFAAIAVHHPACGAKEGLPCVCSAEEQQPDRLTGPTAPNRALRQRPGSRGPGDTGQPTVPASHGPTAPVPTGPEVQQGIVEHTEWRDAPTEPACGFRVVLASGFCDCSLPQGHEPPHEQFRSTQAEKPAGGES